MAEKPEPTRDEIARDYAKGLAIINDLRTRNAELLDALKHAVQVIRDWHSIGFRAPVTADEAWTLYQSSPEMQRLNAAIAKAEGR